MNTDVVSLVLLGLAATAVGLTWAMRWARRRATLTREINPYVVEVEVSTHEDLKDHVLAIPRGLTGSRYRGSREHPELVPHRAKLVHGPTYTVVVVSPDEVKTDAEAMCLAAQMAACSSGQMPTKTTLISWPIEE